MKIDQTRRTTTAVTLMEIIVVIAVMVVLIGLLLPAMSRGKGSHTSRSRCLNNLKQVGLAARIFATDNEERFPWQVSTNTSGSRECLDVPNSAFRHFLAMSNELGTPKVLYCPEDKERTTPNNWLIGNQNISYFIGIDASETNANSFLSGDRNLMTNRVPVGSGLLELRASQKVGWTAKIHNSSGNALFGDGHVEMLSNNRLQEAMINSGVATNRLLIP